MVTFKDYLVEAKFDGENLSRVLNAFQRRMPKLLGAPIYRYGGKEGTDGFGVLYFFKNKAFRVRMKGNSILGIDVWDKYDIRRGPSYFIDISKFSAESILASMTKLANIIKNPEAGKIPVKESVEIQLDEMARRADPKDFARMGTDLFGQGAISKLTWSQIQQIAHENDVLIPGIIKGQRVDKLHWSIIPGDKGSAGGDDQTEADMENDSTITKVGGDSPDDPILYIKVTAQDPKTKRFISAADSKKAQAMYKKLAAAVKGAPTEDELKDPKTMYGHMAQLVEMACRGKLRSLLIYGGPGTGKTYTIMQTVKQEGLVQGKDYVKLSGKASPIAIYETLFMFRDGGLVIFDDLDSMWGDKEATNILKAALDTSPVREISWASANTINVSKMSTEKREQLFKQIDREINGPSDEEVDAMLNDEDEEDDDDAPKKKKKIKPAGKVKFPSTFEFKGRVIFISNLKKDEFDTAIMSRSAKIGMDMTPEQILMRMRDILPSLGGDDVPVEKKEELIQVLIKLNDEGELDQVTMREFTKGLDILRSGAPNWKELVVYA